MNKKLYSCCKSLAAYLYLTVFLLCFLSASLAYADTRIRLSHDPEDLTFYLHTADIAPRLAETYGHVQLRIVNEKQRGDYIVSWGLFDFAAPNFGLNFYRGRLWYSMGIFETRRAEYIYRYDHKTVWQDKLVLNAEQKKKLLARIYTNLQPENRDYLYNYFWDNCSTRPRDFIDFVLGGKLKEHVGEELSAWSWREAVRYHQSLIPMTGLALELLMNSNLDHKMTKWQEMFLPERLRHYLSELPQFTEDGLAIPGTKLLTESQIYYEGATPYPQPGRDLWIFYGLFALTMGVIFGGARVFKAQRRRFFGGAIILWYALGGFFGLLMAVSWVASDHLDLHHNANLLLFWPIDWAMIFPGFLMLLGKPWPKNWFRPFFTWYLYLHVFFLVLLKIGSWTWIEQDTSIVFLTYGMVSLVYWLIILRDLRQGEH